MKNGSLGTVEKVSSGVLQVKLDSVQRVAVDSRFYEDLDHGYAATVYKGQGVTVDRSYVLAIRHFDRHSSYVALSRHREEARVFYAGEDFDDRRAGEAESTQQARHRFLTALARARPKELAHDYLDRDPQMSRGGDGLRAVSMADVDAKQQQAAVRWREQNLASRRRPESVRQPSQSRSRDSTEELDL